MRSNKKWLLLQLYNIITNQRWKTNAAHFQKNSFQCQSHSNSSLAFLLLLPLFPFSFASFRTGRYFRPIPLPFFAPSEKSLTNHANFGLFLNSSIQNSSYGRLTMIFFGHDDSAAFEVHSYHLSFFVKTFLFFLKAEKDFIFQEKLLQNCSFLIQFTTKNAEKG